MDVTPERAEAVAKSMCSILAARCVDAKVVAELEESFAYLLFHEFLDLPGRESMRLQAQAVAMVKQYGLFLPAPAKEFFRKLAEYLKWDDLKGILK